MCAHQQQQRGWWDFKVTMLMHARLQSSNLLPRDAELEPQSEQIESPLPSHVHTVKPHSEETTSSLSLSVSVCLSVGTDDLTYRLLVNMEGHCLAFGLFIYFFKGVNINVSRKQLDGWLSLAHLRCYLHQGLPQSHSLGGPISLLQVFLPAFLMKCSSDH